LSGLKKCLQKLNFNKNGTDPNTAVKTGIL
jgi:hypothetical protein